MSEQKCTTDHWSDENKAWQKAGYPTDKDIPQSLKRTLLAEADYLTSNDRNIDYGNYKEEASQVAHLFNVIREKSLSDQDICWIMICVKIVREQHKHKRDNLVDLAGYIKLLGQLHSEV